MEKETAAVPWNLKEGLIILAILVISGLLTGMLLKGYALGLNLAYRYLVVSLAQAAAVAGGLYYFIKVKYKLKLDTLGFRKERFLDTIVRGIGGGLVLFVIALTAGSLLQFFFPSPELQPFGELILQARHIGDLFIPLFIAGLLAPIIEETFFRGFLFPAIKKRYGFIAGLLGSSILFGLLHFDLIRFLPLTLGGAGLAYLFYRTGNLLVPIVAHATWNLIMIGLLYIYVRLVPVT